LILQNDDYHDGPETNDLTVGGRPETIIEREIREQQEREKEVAAMRSQLLNNDSSKSEVDWNSYKFQSSANGGDDHVVWNSGDKAETEHVKHARFPVDSFVNEEPPPPPSLLPMKSRLSDVNPGEKLIVQELLEQQRREEELRQHWKEMGIELNDYNGNDEDDEGNEDVVDDGNRDYERTVTTVVPDRRAATVVYDSETTRSVTPVTRQEPETTVSIDVPPKLPSTPAPVNVNHRTQLVIDSRVQLPGGWDTNEPIPPETPSRLLRKVHPLPDEDFIGDRDDSLSAVASFFVPVNETLMERELRVAREREEGLRLLRGFLMNTHDEEERRSRPALAIEIQVKSERPIRRSKSEIADRSAVRGGLDVIDSHQPVAEDLEDHEFSKRFAESRLKAELQRQRERELDLRQSGIINTISEERTGDPIKYVEVVDTTSGATSMTPARRQNSLSAGAVPRRATHVEEVPVATAEKGLVNGRTPSSIDAKPPVSVTVVKSNTPTTNAPSFVTSRREIPPVLRTYSYPMPAPDGDTEEYRTANSSKMSSEARIEEEVAEMKRREAELR